MKIDIMTFQSFESLEVWKRACRLAVTVFEVLRDVKEFSLRDQMQRAAVSIASNIAEGSERSRKDFLRFLTFARGSSSELRTQCYIANRIELISQGHMDRLVEERKEINRMLVGLSKAIQRSITKDTET